MDKSKIVSAFKEQFATKFNAETYDTVAEIFSNLEYVTDENYKDIISKSENALKTEQSNFDKRAANIKKENTELKAKLEKKDDTSKDDNQQQQQSSDKKDDNEMPAWFKKHQEDTEKRFQELANEKQATSRRDQYSKLFDGKDEKIKARELAKFDRMNFESDEVFSEFIEAEKAAIADQAKDSLKTGGTFKSVSAPSDKPSDDEIDAIVNDMKI